MNEKNVREFRDISLIDSVNEYDEIVNILKKEINELKDKISKTRITSTSVQRKQLEEEEDLELTEEQFMLLAKERRLKSELKVITSLEPAVEPTNEKVCDLMIDDKYAKMLANLKVQTVFMEERKKELSAAIEVLNTNIERDQEIAGAIYNKIQQFEAREDRLFANTDEMNILNDKINLTKVAVRELAREMAVFLNDYFPAPEGTEDAGNFLLPTNSEINYLSLGNILEMVTNIYIEKPHDCYVDIGDNWWPPHLEMLLRYDILTRHKTNRNKVRLEFYDS